MVLQTKTTNGILIDKFTKVELIIVLPLFACTAAGLINRAWYEVGRILRRFCSLLCQQQREENKCHSWIVCLL